MKFKSFLLISIGILYIFINMFLIYFWDYVWQAKYEKKFPGLKKEAVWSTWVDVDNWNKWDEGTEFAKISGPFEAGTDFTLKPAGGPNISIQLTQVIPFVSFTDVTKFPLAKMYDIHELEETKDGLKLKSTIRMEGPLGWLWRKIVAEDVAAGASKQLEAIAKFSQDKQK